MGFSRDAKFLLNAKPIALGQFDADDPTECAGVAAFNNNKLPNLPGPKMMPVKPLTFENGGPGKIGLRVGRPDFGNRAD
jgi:hypothetical protein